jgi:L-alanine-DL-glutamate epimerase-like enolase superfamily enzyme
VSVQCRTIEAHLRAPFVSAQGSVESVPLELVTVRDAAGVIGRGERIDDARWDAEGRRAGQPVWQLLGARSAPAVEVNATIASPDRAGAASAAAAARDAGYGCVKVKVGLGDDAGRLAAIRAAAGADMAIRVDANGSWSAAEALAALRAFEPAGIELCEQPAGDVDSCAEVAAASPIPIALDESAPDALDDRVCEAVCLKVARFGGISGLVSAARRAREAGYLVYLASMLDGPLGIAAALHAAAVIKPDYACGLATLGLFDGRPDPLAPSDGRLAVPPGPGLGEGLLDWYWH